MKKRVLGIFILTLSLIVGCGGSNLDSSDSNSNTSTTNSTSSTNTSTNDTSSTENDSDNSDSSTLGTRDNTPQVLVPEASGIEAYSNDVAAIDVSNDSEGYIMVSYSGQNQKVKLQIAGPDSITYTYDLAGGYETFPLSAGSGSYTITVFENLYDNQYSTCLSQTVDVTISNEFGAFLYPNQYVMFTSDSLAVQKGAELAQSANSDLDVVSSVYNYVIANITYDYDLANNLESGYIPDPDNTLTTGTGICLDYASLMACMLRSQGIPTQLEVGYAGDVYHAWISTYITDIGWVNGIIQFDGTNWELMDPTFAANSSEDSLKKFIGDASNYVTKYIY